MSAAVSPAQRTPRQVAQFSQFAFPRLYRLTKTDEFSSVFGFRRAIRGQLFMLHYLPQENAAGPARLGLVVGKKLLRQAVRRNVVKRLAREQFRLLHARLNGYDILLRLISKPGRIDRVAMTDEIRQLLGKLRGRVVPAAEIVVDKDAGKDGE